MSDDWSDDDDANTLPGPGDMVPQTSDGGWDDDGDWGDDDDAEMDGHNAVLEAGIVRTPAAVASLARRNAEELKILRLFRGDVELTGTQVHALVGIDLTNIPLITTEQKEVWGLTTEDRYLVVKISCGPYYLTEGTPPRVEVGAQETIDPHVELKPFSLAWTIRERTQNSLLAVWPPEIEGETPPNVDELVELTQDFGLTYSEALEALRMHDNSQANAMMMLADETQKSRLKQKMPSVLECNRMLTNMWDFDEELKQFSSENKEQEDDEDTPMPDSDSETVASATTKKSGGFMRRLFGKGSGEAARDDRGEVIGPQTLAARVLRERDGIRSLATMSKHNYLARLGWFALNVLINGNKNCMICNARMPFVGLKPGVCQKRMCEFGFQELGLGFSLANEILLRPGITDLLISFVVAACHANRVDIFFPVGVAVGSPEKGDEDSFMNGEAPDVAKLLDVSNRIPSVADMTPWAQEGNVVLKQKLMEIHPLMHGLLCWIITSNRTHLRELKQDEIINQLDQATHQFAVCSATPEREQIFQDLKRQYGSFWTYHGSGIGNWHSILRMGLKNYSGTKRQQNGAAYGAGVYLAMNSNTSVSYSGRGGNVWTQTSYNQGFSCLAVCEVINHPDLKEQSAFGGIYVVQEEEYIITRVLILFTGSNLQNINSRNLEVPSYVRQQSE